MWLGGKDDSPFAVKNKGADPILPPSAVFIGGFRLLDEESRGGGSHPGRVGEDRKVLSARHGPHYGTILCGSAVEREVAENG